MKEAHYMHDEVLKLETRRDIYNFIVKFPGLHMREIQRKLNMSIALVEYHLNYLEDVGIVTAIKDDSYKRYYSESGNGIITGENIGYQDRRILGVLRQKIPLKITLFLLKNKQSTHKEISSNLDISPSKLSFHLKKLVKARIARKIKREEGKGYVLVEDMKIQRLLIAHKPPQNMLDEFSELWECLQL